MHTSHVFEDISRGFNVILHPFSMMLLLQGELY